MDLSRRDFLVSGSAAAGGALAGPAHAPRHVARPERAVEVQVRAHDPEGVQVRVITGEDGSEKIQMRIDLGLIQMEINGRPDGERPEGFESLLDVYEARAREAVAPAEKRAMSSPR